MKRLTLVAVAVWLISLCRPCQAQTSGIDLQHECQSAAYGGSRTPEQAMQAAHCLGYISGVAFSITMWQGMAEDNHRGIEDVPACLPATGTNEEYVKVVLHYLEENPNKLHLSYGLLVFLAFRDAYPCPAKGR